PEELALPAEGTAEPLVIDTATAAPGTRLLNASRAVTVAVAEPPTPIDVGFRARVELAPDAAAGVTVMFRVCAIVTPSISAPTSLSPAAVWVYVAVATPLALVGSGVVKEPPPATATGSTLAPAIGFPLASLAVTVTVEPPAPGLPAVMLDGDTVSVDCEALTGPAVIVIWGDASVVRPAEAKTMTRGLRFPVMLRSVKVATPLLLVRKEVVPPSVAPLPFCRTALTVTPDAPTGLPEASCS